MPSKHFFEQLGIDPELADVPEQAAPELWTEAPTVEPALPPATMPIPPQPAPQNLTALDAIRVAARGLRTVILTYTDAKGNTTVRETEPYSLRPGAKGSTRYFGFDYLRGQIRGFRMDRVARAEVTQTAYTPKWVVELG